MANKRITDVDFLESLNSDESFFVNQNNTIKQINKNNIVFDISNGGTGATDAATARTNLEITPENIGAVSTSGGTVSGDLHLVGDLYLGDGTNTSQYDLYIRRTIEEVQKSGRLYWGTGGVLRLQAASDGDIFNYLDLKTDSTDFKQPVTVASGGTGATTAEAALVKLGGVSKAGDTMTGTLDMDAKIVMKNNTCIYGEDADGAECRMIHMSPTNRLQIGYDMPDGYAVQINPMIRITSNSYGTALPDAGNAGRIFFKKVSG